MALLPAAARANLILGGGWALTRWRGAVALINQHAWERRRLRQSAEAGRTQVIGRRAARVLAAWWVFWAWVEAVRLMQQDVRSEAERTEQLRQWRVKHGEEEDDDEYDGEEEEEEEEDDEGEEGSHMDSQRSPSPSARSARSNGTLTARSHGSLTGRSLDSRAGGSEWGRESERGQSTRRTCSTRRSNPSPPTTTPWMTAWRVTSHEPGTSTRALCTTARR